MMTADKAIYDEENDEYRGGIQFERSARAVNVAQGPQCYQASITFQVPKSMAAPGRQTKVTSIQMDDDAKLRKDLLTVRGNYDLNISANTEVVGCQNSNVGSERKSPGWINFDFEGTSRYYEPPKRGHHR